MRIFLMRFRGIRKRINPILAVLFLLFSSLVSADVREYSLEYHGLFPGRTSYDQLVSKFGKGDQDESQYGWKMSYGLFDVTFSISRKKINTIIIYDHSYVDINGLKVGDPVSKVKSQYPCFVFRKSTITDFSKGPNYWVNDGKISKIVLGTGMDFDIDTVLRSDPEFKRRCPGGT